MEQDIHVTKEELQEAFNQLQEYIDASFAKLEAEMVQRVDVIEQRLAELETTLEETKQRVSSVKGGLLSNDQQRVLDGLVVYGPGSKLP